MLAMDKKSVIILSFAILFPLLLCFLLSKGGMVIEKTVESKAQEKFEKIKTSLTHLNFTNTSNNLSTTNISISEILSTNLSKLIIP